eukprot:365383_1
MALSYVNFNGLAPHQIARCAVHKNNALLTRSKRKLENMVAKENEIYRENEKQRKFQEETDWKNGSLKVRNKNIRDSNRVKRDIILRGWLESSIECRDAALNQIITIGNFEKMRDHCIRMAEAD